jgi:hypothetical protein
MEESWDALPAVATRYPVTTLALALGLAYWLGASSRR